MKKATKNITLLIVLSTLINVAVAQDETRIEFVKKSWNESVKIAKEKSRLIFIDFYTDWCGPCLNMAEEVFILPSVSDFYNSTFVNLKIDAEKGEGIELAKRYGVNSYPTYLFIDPNTELVVHRSSSRQSPYQFITTGRNSLIPEKRSQYLEDNYDSNKNNPTFLLDYIEYKSSVYNHERVADAFSNLILSVGSLKNELTWSVFEKYITGHKNPYIQDVIENYDEYCNYFGKERVDLKLSKETNYATVEELSKMCNFEGKYTNIKLSSLSDLSRKRDYKTLAAAIDLLIEDKLIDKQKFINSLKFLIRNRDLKSLPQEWIVKCAEYYQYIAYNSVERRDPYIHYEYAAYLEELIRRVPNATEFFPKSIVEKPLNGKDSYSMRPENLKTKPIRNK